MLRGVFRRVAFNRHICSYRPALPKVFAGRFSARRPRSPGREQIPPFPAVTAPRVSTTACVCSRYGELTTSVPGTALLLLRDTIRITFTQQQWIRFDSETVKTFTFVPVITDS